MPIESKLKVAGGEFPVSKISYGFKRDIDFYGQPKGNVIGGTIHVTVRCEGANSENGLTDWMLDHYKQESGSIEFMGLQQKIEQKVEFEEAFCVGYTEEFNNTDPNLPYTTSLLISAKKISIGGTALDNEWTS